jgi:hypothetical protein
MGRERKVRDAGSTGSFAEETRVIMKGGGGDGDAVVLGACVG